jgi:hypothetical protein
VLAEGHDEAGRVSTTNNFAVGQTAVAINEGLPL